MVLPLFLIFCGLLLSVFITLRHGAVLWYEADREAAGRAEQTVRAAADDAEEIVVVRVWEAGLLPAQRAEAVRRAWTGRFLPETGAHRYVIVTDHASVYHLTEACTYLTLSVREVPQSGVDALRNRDGARYYPCERCAGRGTGGSCYVTETGRRYHTDRNCSGLKRGWRWVPAQDCTLPACSRCGG